MIDKTGKGCQFDEECFNPDNNKPMTIKYFSEMSFKEKDKILLSHQSNYLAKGTMRSREFFNKLFEMANPKIILSDNECQVHEESVEATNKVFDKYL